MNKILKCLILLSFSIALFGCTATNSGLNVEVSPQANPWTNLNLYNNPDNFQFPIISDRTGGNRPGIFSDAIDKLNLLKPEFVMCVGDLIDGQIEDVNELTSQWDQLDGLVDKLEMPFFYVPGNHDISNQVMANLWQQRLGPSYYHFTYHNVLFLCLNTEDLQQANISSEQVRYVQDTLSQNENVRWTLVFMHYPLWKKPQAENWKKIETLLGDRAYTVFAGHEHTYQKRTRNNRLYYGLASTGANAELAGIEHCQFDHVVWVTMTDDGPALANLLLEGVLNDDPCPQGQ